MPPGVSRKLFTSEHHGSPTDTGPFAKAGVRQHHRTRTDRGVGSNVSWPDTHDSVLEEMGLNAGISIDRTSVTEAHHVKLSDGHRVTPHISPNLGPHEA